MPLHLTGFLRCFKRFCSILATLPHARTCSILLVFSVTPFKIDQNKNLNRSIDKVQNLENERKYIYKDPAKIQVRGIFRIRDIRRNVLPKLIEICMETPCWCSPG